MDDTEAIEIKTAFKWYGTNGQEKLSVYGYTTAEPEKGGILLLDLYKSGNDCICATAYPDVFRFKKKYDLLPIEKTIKVVRGGRDTCFERLADAIINVSCVSGMITGIDTSDFVEDWLFGGEEYGKDYTELYDYSGEAADLYGENGKPVTGVGGDDLCFMEVTLPPIYGRLEDLYKIVDETTNGCKYCVFNAYIEDAKTVLVKYFKLCRKQGNE